MTTTSTQPTPPAGSQEITLRGRHSVLVGAVDAYVGDLLGAIDAGDAQAFGAAHGTLASWCQFELVPALAALEQELYPLAQGPAELLRQALVADHRVAAGLVDAINAASDAARLAGDATALRVIARATFAKVDELLVPALVEQDAPAVAAALERVQATSAALAEQYATAVTADVDAAYARTESGCGGGGCGSGGCGGICGTAPDDSRTDAEKAAAREAVSVTRVD